MAHGRSAQPPVVEVCSLAPASQKSSPFTEGKRVQRLWKPEPVIRMHALWTASFQNGVHQPSAPKNVVVAKLWKSAPSYRNPSMEAESVLDSSSPNNARSENALWTAKSDRLVNPLFAPSLVAVAFQSSLGRSLVAPAMVVRAAQS